MPPSPPSPLLCKCTKSSAMQSISTPRNRLTLECKSCTSASHAKIYGNLIHWSTFPAPDRSPYQDLLRMLWYHELKATWKQLVNCRAKKRRPLHHPHHLRHPRTFLNLGGSRSSLAETLEMPSDALLFAKPSIIDRCSANKKTNHWNESRGDKTTNQLD